MTQLPACPLCTCEYTYEMGALLVCPQCAHEWAAGEPTANLDNVFLIKDSAGNILAHGDSVTIVKDLKVKGSATSIKVGTKVRGIRLVEGPGVHQRVGMGAVLGVVAGGRQAFVALDADQSHGSAGVDRTGQRQRLASLAAAGAAVGHADFQQHVERVSDAGRSR